MVLAMRRANSGDRGWPFGEAAAGDFGVAGAGRAADCASEKDAVIVSNVTTSHDLRDTTNLNIYAVIVLFRLSHGASQ